jgi:hypothetical protein
MICGLIRRCEILADLLLSDEQRLFSVGKCMDDTVCYLMVRILFPRDCINQISSTVMLTMPILSDQKHLIMRMLAQACQACQESLAIACFVWEPPTRYEVSFVSTSSCFLEGDL